MESLTRAAVAISILIDQMTPTYWTSCPGFFWRIKKKRLEPEPPDEYGDAADAAGDDDAGDDGDGAGDEGDDDGEDAGDEGDNDGDDDEH